MAIGIYTAKRIVEILKKNRYVVGDVTIASNGDKVKLNDAKITDIFGNTFTINDKEYEMKEIDEINVSKDLASKIEKEALYMIKMSNAFTHIDSYAAGHNRAAETILDHYLKTFNISKGQLMKLYSK